MSKLLVPGLGPILIVIFSIIISWLLIHLMAVFGAFLTVAYPIWWLLAPEKTPCFFCRIKKEGEQCFSCRQKVSEAEGLNPKTFRSTLANTALVLTISIVCAAFVFAESKILFKLGFPPTPKTVSFIIPPKGQYRLDEIFPMKIEIANIKTAINAVQADLGFDPQELEVINISTEDSFASIFIQKEINNEAGYARLTGGLPNPGFFSDHGVFGTIFFKGKRSGITKVEFLPSSMVLANDGRGTNTLKDLASVSYLILPEKISEEEAEMQKSISMKPAVLGEKGENTQMKFYEEEKVLGAQIGKEIQEKRKINLVDMFLNGLETIDRFILVLWGKMLGLLKIIN